jgi:hypothetical protein
MIIRVGIVFMGKTDLTTKMEAVFDRGIALGAYRRKRAVRGWNFP